MSNRTFTLLIVPERSSKVRRIQVPRRLVTFAGAFLLFLVSALTAAGAHYYYVIDQVGQNIALREENTSLRDHLSLASKRLDGINSSLEKIDLLDRKLREITRLSDPARGLAIGPVNEPSAFSGTLESDSGLFTAPPVLDDPDQQQLEFDLLDARLSGLAGEVQRQTASLRELSRFFEEREDLLGRMPSVWPARGWITSEFGLRDDPYTGARTMHHGLDISTAEGHQVIAPAAGTVAFAGPRGGYGNAIVIDHGLGVVTFYAHLSEILVKAGDSVERGRIIGKVGNTGRSTGPHLHYEVRSHDVPVNPKTYILE